MNSSATCGTISNSKLEGLDSTAFGQNNSATLTSSFEDNKLSSKARYLYQQHAPTTDSDVYQAADITEEVGFQVKKQSDSVGLQKISGS